jgi:DNA replication protein DnaC
VRVNVPSTTDFGEAVPCRCASDERRRARDRLARYSYPARSRLTFANIIARGRNAGAREQEQYRACGRRAFADVPGDGSCRPVQWLWQDHIAAAIVNRLLERGEPALFVVVPDLLDHLRAAYQPGAEVAYDELFDRVRNAPVLVLDDLGTQAQTPWAREKLFQLINHRFNRDCRRSSRRTCC